MRVNVSDLLRDTAAAHGDKVALREPASVRQLTWRELDNLVQRRAFGLQQRDLVAGHRVALLMSNSIDFVASYFAVLRCGLVAVPMNPRSMAPEIARMCAQVEPRLLLVDDASRELAESADTAGAIVSAPAMFDEKLGEVATPKDPEALAVVLFTSGASGRPRGAMLTHRALLANIAQLESMERPATLSDDVVLGLLPLFHIYGLNAVLGSVAAVGAELVLVDRFDADGTLELIRSSRVNNLPIAPPVVAAWTGRADVRDKLAGVRIIISGASPLDPSLLAAFEASTGHSIEQGYGLTEAAPVVTTTLCVADPATLNPGSVGLALHGVELQVRDQSGRTSSPGDPGQIWLRGANLFSGYWPDGHDGPGGDGWYATGDIGILGRDLVLVDRLRELAIVSGFNVYPSEIEDVISGYDEVQQVAVVSMPDAQTGERVVAFVVPVDGVGEGLSERVVQYCEQQVARFKVPVAVVVVEDLPRSAVGKIEKGRLRALARSEELGIQ